MKPAHAREAGGGDRGEGIGNSKCQAITSSGLSTGWQQPPLQTYEDQDAIRDRELIQIVQIDAKSDAETSLHCEILSSGAHGQVKNGIQRGRWWQ